MMNIKEKARENLEQNKDDILCVYDKYAGFVDGANYVLEEIEKELQRRMFEDYNQGAKEDEVAQGCMASMIMFVRQLKK